MLQSQPLYLSPLQIISLLVSQSSLHSFPFDYFRGRFLRTSSVLLGCGHSCVMWTWERAMLTHFEVHKVLLHSSIMHQLNDTKIVVIRRVAREEDLPFGFFPREGREKGNWYFPGTLPFPSLPSPQLLVPSCDSPPLMCDPALAYSHPRGFSLSSSNVPF